MSRFCVLKTYTIFISSIYYVTKKLTAVREKPASVYQFCFKVELHLEVIEINFELAIAYCYMYVYLVIGFETRPCK